MRKEGGWILLALGFAACAGHAPREAQRRFDRSDMHEAVAAAAGIPLLRDPEIGGDVREVRVWAGGALGWPKRFVRIWERNGKVRGEAYLYWTRDRDSTRPPEQRFEVGVRANVKGTCGGIRSDGEIEVCRVRFERAPDWAAILASAESAGVWVLPDEKELAPNYLIIDGWSVAVELRSGAGYRTYTYRNPDSRPWPEAKRALAVATAFQTAWSSARTPDVLRVLYRGELRTGPGRHDEFRPCRTRAVWGFNGDLLSLTDSADAPAVAKSAGAPSRYVEVRGYLAPEWKARLWESPYPGVLTVVAVETARPWDPRLCGERGRPIRPRTADEGPGAR